MRDKRNTPLVNLTENEYLQQLKERTVRNDPFGMFKKTSVKEEEEKAIDKEE